MGYLNEEELWQKHHDNNNSAGVLILHLCGNVRQWILSGACGLQDTRERNKEFSPDYQLSKIELEEELHKLVEDLEDNLDKIPADQLLTVKPIQCYEETIFTMIIHAIEHFSYHTGQIVYYVKYLKNVDTAFYAGQDLTVKGN